jgi:hypothetical protein
MPVKDLVGLLLCRRPDCDMRVGAGGNDASVFEMATAFTAPSWKRSTCSAALRLSDHRIADVSKLPDMAFVPSGEIASAFTGPPWPRN